MSRPTEITKKLKVADPELSKYIIELEKENLRLHKQIARLQVKDVSQQNQIRALKNVQPKINIVLPPERP